MLMGSTNLLVEQGLADRPGDHDGRTGIGRLVGHGGWIGQASSAGVVVSVNWTLAAITELLTLFGRSCGRCGGGLGVLLEVLPTRR